jgi:hypothetical protein
VSSTTRLRRAAALAAVLSLAAAGTASAGQRDGDQPFDDARTSGRVLFATTDQNQLIRFNSNRPDRLKDIRSITGLSSPTTRLVGIDFRPATGDLYGLGSDAIVYRVNPRTGIAVSEGPAVTPAPAGRVFGFDFNPTVDKIRVTSDAAVSLRLNVDEGTLLANDPALNPGMPRVVGSAYANSSFSVNKPGATVLYALDAATDTLSVQNPMTSALTTVRRLPFDVQDQAGFDIAGADNVGYIATRSNRGSSLYTVDPVTGRSRLAGRIAGGNRLVVTGLAAWQD